MADHNEFGKIAEEFIVKKYQKNNYKILERNWRFHPLEIDIIAERDNELIIVEVKARSYDDIISPEEAVNKRKKQLLIRAANEYIEQHDLDISCRFDIAVVLKKKNGLVAEIYVNAFEAYEL